MVWRLGGSCCQSPSSYNLSKGVKCMDWHGDTLVNGKIYHVINFIKSQFQQRSLHVWFFPQDRLALMTGDQTAWQEFFGLVALWQTASVGCNMYWHISSHCLQNWNCGKNLKISKYSFLPRFVQVCSDDCTKSSLAATHQRGLLPVEVDYWREVLHADQ